ncbi:hypothetical protein H1Z61_17345 [Bacillus aquiflavi]|uniref:Uncharacterized protein n=1 Tax=Bacillus aquiflavi TaxID=2672567 RepID=A0A6B3W124_9BACI|nr:hypothetical protein [Bacillus aquiflavi]NEY83198.1 hypothetical protein [Bacillus aquiflavi]
MRANNNDIEKIAANIGLPKWKIARIKDHLFYKSHKKDNGVGRFDADPDMADAWERLIEGKNIKSNDIDLLNHEFFESRFEGIFKTNYRTAHDKTIESGRVWFPPKGEE